MEKITANLDQLKTARLELIMKKEDFEKNERIPGKAMRCFAGLKSGWSTLVPFFQMTSNIIDVTLSKSVKTLKDQVEATENRSLVR